MRKLYAILATLVLVAALALAAPAMGFGPQNGPLPAVQACAKVLDIQDGVEAGGGPKSGAGSDTQPTNCDHFWQRSVIGNGWPPTLPF